MDFAEFTIDTDLTGRARYEVNGLDISEHVAQAALLIRPGHIPSLQLELSGSGKVEGRGIVKVLQDDAGAEVSLTQAFLQFLEQVDPVALEQQMLTGGMTDGVGQSALRALRGMALS